MRVYELDDTTGYPTPRSSMTKEEAMIGTFIENVTNMANTALQEIDDNEVHISPTGILWAYANLRGLDEDLTHMIRRYKNRGSVGSDGIDRISKDDFAAEDWRVWNHRHQRYHSRHYYLKEMKIHTDNIVYQCFDWQDILDQKRQQDICNVLFDLVDILTYGQL